MLSVVSITLDAPPLALTLNSWDPVSTPVYWVVCSKARPLMTGGFVSKESLTELASGMALSMRSRASPPPLRSEPQPARATETRNSTKTRARREFIVVSTGGCSACSFGSIVLRHHALQRGGLADDVDGVGLAGQQRHAGQRE